MGGKKMYSLTKDEIDYIPVDFNMFYLSANEYKKSIKYTSQCRISESFVDEIVLEIISKPQMTFVIDMENVVSYSPRVFSKVAEYVDRIIFFNINETYLRDRIESDMPELKWPEKGMACGKQIGILDAKRIVSQECNNIRFEKICNILAGLVDKREDTSIYLESSGLYSNCYVDIKRLFLNVFDYYYIIFVLASMIAPNINSKKIDAFVSSSKNGAIIANVLGGLLDIKEVHLIGVGPKYAMELGDSVECIRNGKKYAYIYDYMCTGTELKIVSALINSKHGELAYAAGIAKYRDETGKNIVKHLDTIACTKDMGINYQISGEKRNIEHKI